jgi:hypothetical protein
MFDHMERSRLIIVRAETVGSFVGVVVFVVNYFWIGLHQSESIHS